jgi:membrane protein
MAADDPGGDTNAPSDIPARAWRDVLRRALRRTSEDGLLTEAAGIAFYAVFALLAGLAAFVSLWGVLGAPAALGRRVREVGGALPAGLPEVLDQLLADAAAPGRGAAALAAALWAATAAAQALTRGLNLVYGERERRGAWRLAGLSLAVALCGAVFALLALAAFLALPSAAGDGAVGALLVVLRWPALLAGATAGLAALYRYGPCRAEPRWRWVSWGGGFAAVAWVVGSAAFSWYARRLGGYGAAYGPLAAVVAFMTWAWLSAAVVLLGAVLNAEAECQTARDTTVGPGRPPGARRAAKADVVEPAPAGSTGDGWAGPRSGRDPRHQAVP